MRRPYNGLPSLRSEGEGEEGEGGEKRGQRDALSECDEEKEQAIGVRARQRCTPQTAPGGEPPPAIRSNPTHAPPGVGWRVGGLAWEEGGSRSRQGQSKKKNAVVGHVGDIIGCFVVLLYNK